jgi:hypothetical protein
MKNRFLFTALIALFVSAAPGAQEFGFGSEEDGSPAPALSVKLGGEVKAEMTGFFDDFENLEKFKASNPGDIFTGKLNFSASASNVDGVINLNLAADPDSPVAIDEAYIRAYFGPANIEAGLRKLTWGKADSFGPLDVVNPFDYSDASQMTDVLGIKIARPMVHGSLTIGSNSKLEAVFIPNFVGHRFADSDSRWYPEQIKKLPGTVKGGIISAFMQDYYSSVTPPYGDGIKANLESADPSSYNITMPKTDSIEYAQAGLRFTTTLGPADLGIQYFYGNLPRPAYSFEGIDDFLKDLIAGNITSPSPPYTGDPSKIARIEYNRYHQIGADYAQVIAGFNVRAELAAHITEDIAGDKGWVRNPFIGWSLGFDRDVIWGINVNIQCNETIRLFNDKSDNPLVNFEAGTDATATRLTMIVSRKFLRDNLELRCTGIIDPETPDFYIIPAVSWIIKDIKAELAAGFFTGKDGGELSQYWNNNFIRAGLTYTF